MRKVERGRPLNRKEEKSRGKYGVRRISLESGHHLVPRLRLSLLERPAWISSSTEDCDWVSVISSRFLKKILVYRAQNITE